jgi:hypothetical protein
MITEEEEKVNKLYRLGRIERLARELYVKYASLTIADSFRNAEAFEAIAEAKRKEAGL